MNLINLRITFHATFVFASNSQQNTPSRFWFSLMLMRFQLGSYLNPEAKGRDGEKRHGCMAHLGGRITQPPCGYKPGWNILLNVVSLVSHVWHVREPQRVKAFAV